MKKENKEIEKILDLSLIPRSLLRYCSPLMFISSPRTRTTTLIPRHVTHIQVYAVISTDMRMHRSQQLYRPQTSTDFQNGTRAVNNVNPQINDTDLHKAAQSGSLNKAREAVSANRELLRRQNAQGNLPLHLAVEVGHKKVAMYLVEEYPQGSYTLNAECLSPLCLAVEGRHLDLVDFMFRNLASDPDLISEIKKGKSIVHAAIVNHNQEMLQMIRKHQPELIKKARDAEGRTPLSCAAYNGFADMVEYLLKEFPKSKSDFDGDKNRSHAVHKACQRGHIEVLKVFHAYFPKSFRAQDRYGQTILHLAAKEPKDKLKEVVSYLVGLPGVGEELLSIDDENGCIPLDLARSNKNHQIVEILQQYNA
ncbi:hypothetical protein Cgig2_025629 [Carnegiea gigantea]|uniref:Uncharacterized protein n=1 Tax=Carnegiea gigantea TaxID=171969 RepID=A0A9Q1JV55_9CARY|nr:hypothetical protein Cgig2_025629 [Carnegiea gigantea]